MLPWRVLTVEVCFAITFLGGCGRGLGLCLRLGLGLCLGLRLGGRLTFAVTTTAVHVLALRPHLTLMVEPTSIPSRSSL